MEIGVWRVGGELALLQTVNSYDSAAHEGLIDAITVKLQEGAAGGLCQPHHSPLSPKNPSQGGSMGQEGMVAPELGAPTAAGRGQVRVWLVWREVE